LILPSCPIFAAAFINYILLAYPRADGAGTNSPRLFTPGETKALAKSKVYQSSRALTNDLEWVVILTDLKNMASKISILKDIYLENRHIYTTSLK
jgi:hypothetical protein